MPKTNHPYQSMSDEQLMVLIAKRDSKAFEMLYDRYSKLLYNYFHRMLWKDKEKARDFTQDLFAKLIHKPEYFQEGRAFKTWFYSMAHNMCKNEYAKHEVRQNAHSQIKLQTGSTSFNTAQSDMDRHEFNQQLEVELSKLDEVKRTTFELRFRQEMSVQDISEVMQCSEGTVKSRLFYTLKELNLKLKKFEGIAVWMFGWIMEGIIN